MSAMREAWTDERLDDLTKRVDEGFRESRQDQRSFRGEIKLDFASLRTEVDSRFDKVDERFEGLESSIDARFDKVDKRFDAIDRRFDMMFAALVTGFIGLIVTGFIGLIVNRLVG
jgi:tetrahydromethanopterin S-methyltransferase subunit G